MSELLYKCLTKAVEGQGSQLNYGPNWAFARRGFLKVFNDHLECGDWKIDNKQIKDAVISPVRSILFFPGYVIRVSTADKTYHFGVHGNRFWSSPLPFPARIEAGVFSIRNLVIRILFIGYLVYLLSKWVNQ